MFFPAISHLPCECSLLHRPIKTRTNQTSETKQAGPPDHISIRVILEGEAERARRRPPDHVSIRVILEGEAEHARRRQSFFCRPKTKGLTEQVEAVGEVVDLSMEDD